IASSARPAPAPVNMREGTMNGRCSPPGLDSMSCHDRPYLSWIHPKRSLNGYLSSGMSGVPPAESLSQVASRVSRARGSRDGSKLRKNEIDGLSLNKGPALIDMNLKSASSNETTSQSPEGVSWSVVRLVTRD